MTAAFSAHPTNDGIFYEVTDMTDNFMVDIGFLALMDEVDRQEQDEADCFHPPGCPHRCPTCGALWCTRSHDDY
jgi:hypothetical protein